MNGAGFRRRAKRYAKRANLKCWFVPSHGKGSHGRLYIGANFTTVKHGEIDTRLLNAMLKQLKVRKEDF